ncbi:MAG TPA: LptF/LptG family permease [Ignavibacteriales bacterium]|nr:LptF/LptG family permease [Ignavibacteriales bacterium]HRR17580.1 LptF/LptG family permease [Ignavibacteriales bacterium]
MKLIKYIILNHIIPFIFSAFILIFIFLLQFLMKYAEKIVGKGLSIWVIIKLIVYNLAWILVLVIPMSVLISTLMAFGNLSQRNEITIMKASGVSVYKMLIPPLIWSFFIAYFLVYFNNNIYPDANHNARLLLSDISRTKPTLSLVPGVFSKEIPNNAILVRKLDPNSNIMEDITVYNYTNPNQISIITAKKGKVFFTSDNSKLIFELENGQIHQKTSDNREIYQKFIFKNHKIAFPADDFNFKQSGNVAQRSGREMSAADLEEVADSLQQIKYQYEQSFRAIFYRAIADSLFFNTSIYNDDEKEYQIQLKIISNNNLLRSQIENIKFYQDEINSFLVEYHKKYSIPFACIVFIIIGAPLGIKIKKGGFGVAAGVSLLFFLIYWAFLIGGEKLADRSIISPFWSMWTPNFLLLIAGLIITYRANQELSSFDFTFLNKFIPKKLQFSKEDNNSI